jgi:rRNA maturation endonuclease Nob1
VEKVITLDYTFERRLELQREEGRIAEIFSSVQAGDYGIERAAEKLNISVEEASRQMENVGIGFLRRCKEHTRNAP